MSEQTEGDSATERTLASYRLDQELRDGARDYAHRRWREALTALGRGESPPPRVHPGQNGEDRRLAQLDDEALAIIDRFALGAAAEALSGGGEALASVAGMPGTEFDHALDLIIDGLAYRSSVQREKPPESTEPRPQIFQSELWQLLHKVRESAELSYAREIDLVELDRRILFMLRRQGPLVPANLSASIGVDKAQVSRSVKRLLELRMIERKQIRSPLTLTRRGEAQADRLLRLAELRNRELCFDISDRELQAFFGTLEVLMDRAVQLHEMEREKADGAVQDPPPGLGLHERKAGDKVVIDRSRIVSPLLTLSAYFARSGALAYKRLIGLSNFEAWVLSEISYDPPTEWGRLVKALERDHSQAGRTVNTLIERGLVKREGRPGRRHGRFSPTEEGKGLYDKLLDASQKRAAFLMEPLSPSQLSAFVATFDKVRRNAAAQLQRERSLEEMEGR